MIIPPSSSDPTHNKIDVLSFHHTALLLLLCYPSCSCHVVTFIYPMLAHTIASPPRVSSHHCALLYYYPCMHCSYIMTRRRLTLHFPQLSVSQLPLFSRCIEK
ncbi:hypothetical protein BC826DRAFT_442054 [Russula brevipes]|nr:hypothetical protein BC826DRAFT_442054 [Russula brevipes]